MCLSNSFGIPFKFSPMSSIRDYIELKIQTVSENESFSLWLDSASVDFGDGTIVDYIDEIPSMRTHIYQSTGIKRIKIYNKYQIKYLSFGAGGTTPTSIKSITKIGMGVSSLLSASYMFQNCSSLTSQYDKDLLKDNNEITSLYGAWVSNITISIFPDVNELTNTTTLYRTWDGCSNAVVFPEVNALTKNNNLNQTWYQCSNGSIFPNVNAMTNVTTLYRTWAECNKGIFFPSVLTLTNNNDLRQTWWACNNTTNIPIVNVMTNVTSLEQTWSMCYRVTNFPTVSALTKNTSLRQTWWACSSATNFPYVNTMTNVVTLQQAWHSCTNAKSLPNVNSLTKVRNINQAWYNCSSATNIPLLPLSSSELYNVEEAFYGNCLNMVGAVPILWNKTNFPNIILYERCFGGLNPDNISNWDDIPEDWTK